MCGAELKALTQATAYKIIKKIEMNSDAYQVKTDRRATEQNVGAAVSKAATERLCGTREQL